MTTDLQKLQQKKIDTLETGIPIYLNAALRRWKNLQPSLRLRKLQALKSLLSRDLPSFDKTKK